MKQLNIRIWRGLFLAGTFLPFGELLQATTVTNVITDIGAFAGEATPNVGQTYPGTGFVGLSSSVSGGLFAHCFGAGGGEATVLEVDMSAFSHAQINSARLEFKADHYADSVLDIRVLSFSANGNLGFFYNPPDNLGYSYFFPNATSISLDVTTLVQARANAGAAWLGLHLWSLDTIAYTYTDPTEGDYSADSAQVRLIVDYTAIPEPSMFALTGLGAAALLITGRRRYPPSDSDDPAG
jgi:hypothetical protein